MKLQFITTLIITLLVILPFSIAGTATPITVKVITDKSTYFEGDTVKINVQLGPYQGNKPTFRTTNLYITASDRGGALSFNDGTVLSVADPIYSSLDKNEKSTAHINSGIYYGWWVKKSVSDAITLTGFRNLASFTAKIKENSFPVGGRADINLDIDSIKSYIQDWDASLNPIPLTINVEKATITAKDRCGNGVCEKVENGEDIINCLVDCGCNNDQICTSPTYPFYNSETPYCVGRLCRSGNVGDFCDASSNCDPSNYCVSGSCSGGGYSSCCQNGEINSPCSNGNDGTCDAGNYCVNSVCKGGSAGDACIDTADCDTGFLCDAGICALDSDRDGTPDSRDGCPNNPGKIAPGVCGCNVADTDSDSDTILDCQDRCPNKGGNIFLILAGSSIYSSTNSLFTFLGCLKGDITSDDKVDIADYSPWLVQYRSGGTGLPQRGDMDQDGKVDIADYSPWLVQYRLG